MKQYLTKPFLIVLLLLSILACYLVFKPYLTEILVAAVLVSIFYGPYQWLVKALKGKKNISAVIMCILLVLLIIIPVVNLIVFAAEESIDAYHDSVKFINENSVDSYIENSFLNRFNFLGLDFNSLESFATDILKKSSDWLVDGATVLIKGTTKFIFSLSMIILAMFFFFVDGKNMLNKLMYWSPLPNKYDKEIFNKFRAVSYSTIVSTFVTAAAQGVVGAIGFIIIGLPAFLPGMLMGFLSLLPYVGSAIVYVPVGIFLLATGQIWQGVFLLAWGAIVIGNTDNIIRGYMIKGKAQVNPIFIIFAILGGITLFGFWGVILGPLIIAIAVTVLHIYELEYKDALDKR